MMQALLVIDVQHALMDLGDFQEELANIEEIIKDFQAANKPVIFIKHVADDEASPFYKESDGVEIHASLKEYAECVIEKRTPSAFFETELSETLEKLEVDHVFITGFNAEFCCMFTAITAFDRGYKVTFVEEATGTVNTNETYEIPGLDIRDFVGSVLHWSNVVEVLDNEEYVERYRLK
jgi:nicotinamidase-related amidase